MCASSAPFRRKIFRAPEADYMHEWDTALAAHGDTQLDALGADGFDAIWLRGVLRDLVRTEVFPELAPRAEENQHLLNSLLARCRKHGLDVFLYLNEPLGFPADDPFWSRHPGVRGEPDSSYDDGWDRSNALCTTTDEARAFLYQSTRNLFRAVPDLAGAFLITASEHHTHCYSHHAGYREGRCPQCPRCRSRAPAEVIGEIVALLQKGAQEAKPSAEIIAWNWSWTMFEPDPQTEIIRHLPCGVSLLADFERGGSCHISLARDGVRIERDIEIDEYSLAYIGPSPRFRRTFDAAHARGIVCYAKLQIGTTHEIATVPNLPLIPNLYRKFQQMRALGVEGFLGCWNFGSDPSLNTFAVGKLLREPFPETEDDFLHLVAKEYFPGCLSESVVEAWRDFCHAMEMHPFSHAFIYFGPVNYAPVRPWRLDPPSRSLEPSWHIRNDYGDKLEQSCGPFSVLEIEEMLSELVDRWTDGVGKLERGLSAAVPTLHVQQELGVARMIGHQFRSARNIFRFRRLHEAGVTWADTVRDEVANLEACLPVVEADPRLGVHRGSFPRPYRFYDASRIRQQSDALKQLLDTQ